MYFDLPAVPHSPSSLIDEISRVPGWQSTHWRAQDLELLFLPLAPKCWITGIHHYSRFKQSRGLNSRLNAYSTSALLRELQAQFQQNGLELNNFCDAWR